MIVDRHRPLRLPKRQGSDTDIVPKAPHILEVVRKQTSQRGQEIASNRLAFNLVYKRLYKRFDHNERLGTWCKVLLYIVFPIALSTHLRKLSPFFVFWGRPYHFTVLFHLEPFSNPPYYNWSVGILTAAHMFPLKPLKIKCQYPACKSSCQFQPIWKILKKSTSKSCPKTSWTWVKHNLYLTL